MNIHNVCMEGWVCAYNCGVVWSECLIYFMAEERTNERDVCENNWAWWRKKLWSGRCPDARDEKQEWIDKRVNLWELNIICVS